MKVLGILPFFLISVCEGGCKKIRGNLEENIKGKAYFIGIPEKAQ